MAVYRLLFLDSVAVLSDVFVGVFEVSTDEKPNSSDIPTSECQDWRIVSLEGRAPLFMSPRDRGLSSSFFSPFSPAAM